MPTRASHLPRWMFLLRQASLYRFYKIYCWSRGGFLYYGLLHQENWFYKNSLEWFFIKSGCCPHRPVLSRGTQIWFPHLGMFFSRTLWHHINASLPAPSIIFPRVAGSVQGSLLTVPHDEQGLWAQCWCILSIFCTVVRIFILHNSMYFKYEPVQYLFHNIQIHFRKKNIIGSPIDYWGTQWSKTIRNVWSII